MQAEAGFAHGEGRFDDDAGADWKADVGFVYLAEQQLLPERLDCDGSTAVLRDPFTDAVWRLLTGGGGGEILPASGQTTFPLALSPDGATVIANLDSSANPGPSPARWTESGYWQPLEPLRNTRA